MLLSPQLRAGTSITNITNHLLTCGISLQEYLESLDPFEGRSDTEMEDYLYQLSLEIEPRNCKQLVKHVSRRGK